MKGFLVGTVALVALGTVLKADYGIARLQEGTNLFSRGLRRLLAPDVAGIPNKAKSSGTSSDTSNSGYAVPQVTNPYGTTLV